MLYMPGDHLVESESTPETLDIESALNVIIMELPSGDGEYRVFKQTSCAPEDWDSEFRAFAGEAARIEQEEYKRSYEKSGEGMEMFTCPFFDLTETSDVYHIGLYDQSGKLMMFSTFYQNLGRSAILEENQEQVDINQHIPKLVVRKIVRSSAFRRELAEMGSPQKRVLLELVYELASKSDEGLMMEEQLQGDSYNMLSKHMKQVFPRVKVLVDVPSEEDPDAHVMLMKYPKLNLLDKVSIITARRLFTKRGERLRDKRLERNP